MVACRTLKMDRCYSLEPLVAQEQHTPASQDSGYPDSQFASVAMMAAGLAQHRSVDVSLPVLLHNIDMCSVCVYVCPAAVACSELAAPLNGQVLFSSTAFGAVARYRCSPGFTLSGVRSRTCKSDGTWSGTTPTCICEHDYSLCTYDIG